MDPVADDRTAQLLAADERAGRAPFVLAALCAAPVLLLLGAAAPGGASWRWLEFPPRVTAIALLLAIWAGRRRSATGAAILVLLGTPLIHFFWEAIGDWITLLRIPHHEQFHLELDLTARNSLGAGAAWLLGAAGAALAALTVARRSGAGDAADRNRARAASWLASVGVIAIGLDLANESWLTLENLTERGTYRSSTAWPDTKVLTLIAALATAAGGAAWIVWMTRRRAARRALLARIARGEVEGWRIAAATENAKALPILPILLDDGGAASAVLIAEGAASSSYREGGIRKAIARVAPR